MLEKRKGIIAVLLAAMIWGGGFIATSKSLDSFPTLTMLSIRFSVAALIILVIFFKRIRKITKKEFIRGIPLGIFLFLAFATQTYGLNFTTVANNSFLTALNVIFTPYIVWIIYKQKPSNKIFLASILSLIGVGILTMNGVTFSLNIGDAITLLAALCFSLHVIWASSMSDVDHVITTFVQMVVAAIISTISAGLFDPKLEQVSSSSIVSLIYLIVAATVISYLLQMYGARQISSSMVSILLSTEAMFATVFSFFILHEKLDGKSLISILLMSIAVLISSKEENIEEDIQDSIEEITG